MNEYCILARPALLDKAELKAMAKFFKVYTLRSQIPEGYQVIGRMSVLPYYRETFEDIANLGSTLINSPYEHESITSLDWINCVNLDTFPTWHRAQDIPTHLHNEAFVVKGAVNSKKFQWNTSMYAANFKEAVDISIRLRNDAFIGMQPIVFRQYMPLKQYAKDDISGLPYVNEWRIFCFDEKIVFEQFYWEQFVCEDSPHYVEDANRHYAKTGRAFAERMLALFRAQGDVSIPRFMAMDIAQKEDGSWIIVELNDGQMSGLNGAEPLAFYEALKFAILST